MASLLQWQDKKKQLEAGLNQGQSWEAISRNTGIDLNTVRTYSKATRPNYGIPQAPQRQAPQRPAPSPTASQYKGVTGTDWNKAASNVGNFFLNGTAKLVNQGLSIVENTGAHAAGDVVGLVNKQAGQNIINDTKQHVDQQLLAQGKGLFGAGGVYNSTDALHNAKPADVAVRAGGTALQSITERAAPGFTKFAVKGAAPIVNKAVRSAIGGSVLSGANSVGSQLSNTGKVNPIETLKAAALGAGVGAAVPVVGAGVVKAGQVARPVIQKAGKQVDAAYSAVNKNSAAFNAKQQQLADHISLIQQNDEKMAAQGLSANSAPRINNRKAIQAAAQLQQQGGYAKLPFREPGEADIAPHVQEYSQAVSKPEAIVKETTDYWYKHGKDTKGGQLIDTSNYNDPYGAGGGMKRISEHNQFYSDFMSQNKRPPTKADYQNEVTRQLENGGGSMVQPDQAQAYALVRQRNAENDALAQSLSPMPTKPYPAPAPARTMPKPVTLAEPRQIIPAPPRAIATSADNLPQLPNNDLTVPTAQPTKTTRYASKTIPQSEYVGEQVSAQTQKNAPTYTPQTERGRYAQTLRSADQTGFDNFENDVQQRLDGPHIDSQTVSDSQAVAQRLEAKGDDSSLRRAADIYDKLSAHLTRAGQTVQAAAIMARRTASGIKYHALNDLRKAQVKITPEIQREINDKATQIDRLPISSEKRRQAIAEMGKIVEKHTPQSLIKNVDSVWKAMLLSGVKTTGGNILSNTTFAGLRGIAHPISSVADDAMSLFTHKKTIVPTGRGLVSGTTEGVKKGAYTMKTGIDLRNASDKYEGHAGINFKNKTVQKVLGGPAQAVFNFMSAQDQPFYFSHLKNSLYDQAKADGINKKLTGRALSDHMNMTVANPPEAMMQRAVNEASKDVLGYDTVAYKAVQGAHTAIEHMPTNQVTKDVANAVIDRLAPFVRVPTAFLSRTIDYTPLGIGKELVMQAANKKFDQRALSKAIGEGITGTGVIGLGVMLARSGQLSGDYPTDPKEAQRWKAEGIQPNSIKLGGNWYSLNYLGPIGLLFGAGKKFQQSVDSGGNGAEAVAQAAAGFGQTLLGQSFLQGLSGFIDASKDPSRYLQNYVQNQAGSNIPAFINDAANVTDQYQREANSMLDTIKSRIPGLRQGLNVKQDVYGNPLTQNAGGVGMLNPLKPSQVRANDVISEVGRLHNVDPNNPDLQVTPTAVGKTVNINGTQVSLNDQQRHDLQKQVGQATQKAWSELIATPKYKSLSDADKATALTNARQDVTAVQTRQYVADNKLGTYSKDLSKSQQKIASGSSDMASYAKSSSDKSKSASSTYKDKYDTAVKEMNSEDAKKWSPVVKQKKQRDLALLKVQKDYENDTVSLYGMSKSDVYDFVSSNPDGQKYVSAVLKYGDALVNAGLTATNKFRDKNGNLKLDSGKTASASSSSKKSSGTKKVSSGSRGRTSSGITAGKALVSLNSSLNKIRIPKTTGSTIKSSKITLPQMKKASLRKYSVATTKVSKNKV